MMTSPYCAAAAADYTRDLYGASDATVRHHAELTLRHGPVHGTGAIHRQSALSAPSADMKFERGGGGGALAVSDTVALHGTVGAAARCWNTQHDVYAPSPTTPRTSHRVGHSFQPASLDGGVVAPAWHSFPAYVQPCKF
jgi:hypothetical protein